MKEDPGERERRRRHVLGGRDQRRAAGEIPGAVVWTMFPAWTLLLGLRLR
ncbi:hypothetical protein AB0K16_49345 [Nonomuraea jabiensis]